ncbi:MAG: alpha/beta hydrolase [Actinobacteria bacterium]|nr:alpha/beta hydrolase [Actinomycetota bacterium]
MRVVSAGDGSPVVLFDSALGMPLEAWSLVAPTIAMQNRVILWDRPGIGRSGPPASWDAEGMAAAMATVIRSVDETSVIVVGHSRGGIHALALAAFHPELLAGMVLVESSHPDQLNRMPASDGPLLRAVRLLSRAPRPLAKLPAHAVRLLVRARGDRARPGARAMAELAPALSARLDGFVAEHDNGPALLADVAQAIVDRGVPDVPVIVLTGDLNYADPADQATWNGMHEELAALSPLGRHVHVECGHEMPFSSPNAVIDAINEVTRQAGPS